MRKLLIVANSIDGDSIRNLLDAKSRRSRTVWSTYHDAMSRFHRWLLNLRIPAIAEVKWVLYAPVPYHSSNGCSARRG